MTPKQFNELQRQADVIEAHAKNMQVNKAVELYLETLALPFTDINEQSYKWHDLYSKECELFSIMSKFTKSESSEYKKRIKSETFKWRINKVKGFFMLNEDTVFHDEGHGYIETSTEWGGMKVTVFIYRDVARDVEFFVDTFNSSEVNRVYNSRIQKEREISDQFKEYIKQ